MSISYVTHPTRSAAAGAGHRGIRVNEIAPALLMPVDGGFLLHNAGSA